MTRRIPLLLATAVFTFSLTEVVAFADSFTYKAAGTANGYPVSGIVSIQTSANVITVNLTDTVVNPTSIDQNLSGVGFELSTDLAPPNLDTIASSSATQRTVRKDGSFTNALGLDPSWVLVKSFPNFVFVQDDYPLIPPAHTIVGTPAGSRYSKANSTIAGNGPNNPFLAGTATFVLSLQDMTPNTRVEKVDFDFGPLDTAVIIPGTAAPGTVTPEPVPTMLLAVAFIAVATFKMVGAWLKDAALFRQRVTALHQARQMAVLLLFHAHLRQQSLAQIQGEQLGVPGVGLFSQTG
jgi:hypothetical protein